MARYNPKTAQQDVGAPTQEEIVIERREVVGTIPLGGGSHPALEVAFAHIGLYMQENLAEQPMSLEFMFLGRKFTGLAHPIFSPEEREARGMEDGDFE